IVGSYHKFFIPLSAILGAFVLLCADSLSRTIIAPAVLPIGIITAILGAPFFLWLLLKNRQHPKA
ncbi:iron chelate uptake ABC transporter family permease subunit, partial [Aliarcobacter butzleri]